MSQESIHEIEKIKSTYKYQISRRLTDQDYSESVLHDLEWLFMQSEDRIQEIIRFGKGRAKAITKGKKMGGRKSRISSLLECAEIFFDMSSRDLSNSIRIKQTIEYMHMQSDFYAQSTIYKAVRKFKEKHNFSS